MVGKQAWKIACISFFVLSLELALIRMIPAEVKAVSYFTNLLLFSSFFGLGLGCIISKLRRPDWLLPLGGLLTFALVALLRGIVIYETGTTVHYWLMADQRAQPTFELPLVLAALLVFVVGSIPFIAMGQALARAMEEHTRLRAYSWDLGGSLVGTIAFSIMAVLGFPPWAWVAIVLVGWSLLFVPGWKWRVPYWLVAGCFFYFAGGTYAWVWSPYYFLQYSVTESSLTVWVNSSFHQEAVNFATRDPAYGEAARQLFAKFSVPYQVYARLHQGRPPAKVLILGAGTGNDVNVALANGASEITAVEIDAEIADLGRRYNALEPYQQPAVELVIDDGRHFLWNTKERYDLIVFGTLDSQTLLSGQANLRLDNFVYTAESFRDARAALADGGMLVAYYSVFKPWLFGRIYATFRQAFDGEMTLFRFQDNHLFNAAIVGGKGVAGFTSDPEVDRAFEDAVASTDDWPYIYLERRTISPLYLTVFAFVAVLAGGVFLVLRRLEASEDHHVNFFLLGLGFTLLQAAAIVRLALLFGTTWSVSAVVFASTLLTVFLANVVVARGGGPRIEAAWVLLVVALLANFAFPVDVLIRVALPLRVLGAMVLIGCPVFLAGICFSRLFRAQATTGFPLGINLVGAMMGGLLEYLSMVVGMRRIWLLLVAVYLAAHLATRAAARREAAAAPSLQSPNLA